MPPPLPRCSSGAYSSLILSRHISLPRKGRRVGLHIVLLEACSAFTRVAACTLARSPIRDPLSEGFSHFVASMTAPMLPAGANRRVGLAPTYLGHWCQAEIFSIADCIFAEVVDDVGVKNGSFAIAANSGKCAGRPRFCHCGKDRINLSPVRSSGP